MAASSEEPRTYRAAVVHKFREPLTIDEVHAGKVAARVVFEL